MRRCVIVGGADIHNYPLIRDSLEADDFLIGCDCGMRHMEQLGRSADLIVGDFDSSGNPHLETETIVLPCEKDDTDTVFAVKEAVRRGFRSFLLIGMIGARLDHTIGNVSILLYLARLGLEGRILDDYSEMEIISTSPKTIEETFSSFSVLNIDGSAESVTIRGAKYPLESARIPCDYQYGISNEVLPGKTACVKVDRGRALLIRNR